MTKKEQVLLYLKQMVSSIIKKEENTTINLWMDRVIIETEKGNYTLLLLTPGHKEIIWCVDDFKVRAEEIAERYNKPWQEVYDESKFQDALDEMIHNMDCNFGVSWDTIDTYLEEYCKIEENE